MALLTIFTNKDNPNRWRPYERPSLCGAFGEITEINALDLIPKGIQYVYWKLSAEKTTDEMWTKAVQDSERFGLSGVKEINRPVGWPAVHAKELAFLAWAQVGIACPSWGPFGRIENLFSVLKDDLPCLVRVNDGNTGEGSMLCRTWGDLYAAWQLLPVWYVDVMRKYGRSNLRKFIRVKFVNHLRHGYRYSYRIVVAGDRVVGGYARLCLPEEWVAITGQFRPDMADAFLEHQAECQAFCRGQEALIVRSVHALGLNWQGVDVIFDEEERPVFLEVQPDYSCGNPRYGDRPPFYNPSYPDLVKFLTENETAVRSAAPGYWENWLDKQNHFRTCAMHVKRHLDG